ncbi:MAG: rod shape-determining protein MreD [Alicyclobacillus macrosporangiidus]|uniref:rod shape-determining protein MreD n=1 Tax=Alicyclobacillus macrosporangiidus TaxID=392015 RepID=UPI0026EF5B78|nr:rod shape-determining protein MreD [Alicyclobacillus macrosporangiidus]MCL6598479.1 rod shape-determining protein MreD [Alicyclobacillus macrosporangiidus]
MRNAIAFALLWLALILQSTWFQIPPLHEIQPDFVLVVLTVAALTRGPRPALVMGVLIGVIQDANYGSFLGLYAFAYGVVGYFSAVFFSQFLQRNVALTFVVTVCATFLFEWLTYGMTRLFGVTAYTWQVALALTLQQMIIDGVTLLVLYPILVRWMSDRPRRGFAATEDDTP